MTPAAGGALNLETLNALTFGSDSTGTLSYTANSHNVASINTNAIVGTPSVNFGTSTGSLSIFNTTPNV